MTEEEKKTAEEMADRVKAELQEEIPSSPQQLSQPAESQEDTA